MVLRQTGWPSENPGTLAAQNSLHDGTLGLSKLLDVDVPEHEDPDSGQGHDDEAGSQHSCLGIAVRLLDGESRRAVDGVGQLSREHTVDHGDVGHGLLGQVALEGGEEGVGPDSTRDGTADGATDATRDVQSGQSSGNVLLLDGSKDSQLHVEDEDGAGDRDEDLTHNNVADVLVRLAEVDHKALGEEVQRDGRVEEPLEVASAADSVTNDEEEDTRDDLEGRVDISSLGRLEVGNDLQERGEVEVPAVVRGLVGHVDEARADDSAVGEELALEEGNGGPVVLPETEQDEDDEADDDHGDDVVGLPAARSVASEREWQKEDGQAATKEEDTDNCQSC